MRFNDFYIRRAQMSDIPALRAMQDRSMRHLGGDYYAGDTLSVFLARISTMDDSVVAEGHYFAAIDIAGHYVGCGGWSQRLPGYAAYEEEAVVQAAMPADLAIVRSVFVDPGRARAGIGSSLMAHVESDAASRGITQLNLTATLSGVDFYHAHGYRTVGVGEIDLGLATGFGYVEMTKPLGNSRRDERNAS